MLLAKYWISRGDCISRRSIFGVKTLVYSRFAFRIGHFIRCITVNKTSQLLS